MPVARAMVAREACHHDRPRADHTIPRPRLFDDLAEPDQRDLRRIDDPEDSFDALLTEAGDRDRRIGNFRTAEHAGTHAFYQIAQTHHDLAEALLVDVRELPAR